jgi:hypothetical protein
MISTVSGVADTLMPALPSAARLARPVPPVVEEVTRRT